VAVESDHPFRYACRTSACQDNGSIVGPDGTRWPRGIPMLSQQTLQPVIALLKGDPMAALLFLEQRK
jgi:hypothetical protein